MNETRELCNQLVEVLTPAAAIRLEAAGEGKVFYFDPVKKNFYSLDPTMPLVEIVKDLEKALAIIAFLEV